MAVETETTTPAPTPDAPSSTEAEPRPSTPETAAPDSAAAEPADASSAAADTQEPPKKTYADWREAIADADADELLKDPRVAGRLGQVADRLKRDAIAQYEREQQQKQADDKLKAEEARLKDLRVNDKWAYADEMERIEKEQEQARAQAERESAIAQIMGGDIQRSVNDRLAKILPPETLSALGSKKYEGTFHEGLATFIEEAVETSREHWIAAERPRIEEELRAKWEKEDRPTLKRQVLAELNGAEPTPEVSPGRSNSGSSAASTISTIDEANVAFNEGEINRTEFLKFRERFGVR